MAGNVKQDSITEKDEKAKYDAADRIVRDEIASVLDAVQKHQHIWDEISALGVSEDEYWQQIVKGTGERSGWQKSRDLDEFIKKLDEKDLEPKVKFQCVMQHLAVEESVKIRKQMYEDRKKNRFKNFGQFNYSRTNILEQVAVKNGLAVAIFLYFARKSDGYNKIVCPYKTLQKEFNVSERSVSRAIALLEENKLITIYKSGTANEYVLCDDVTWKSRPGQHDKCKYDIKVIRERGEKREKRREKGKEVAARRKEQAEKETLAEEEQMEKEMITRMK